MNIYLKMFIHELRTPLSTFAVGLTLLESKYDPDIVRDMKTSIAFMEDMFTRFAMIQDGNIVLNPYDVFSWSHLMDRVEGIMRYYTVDTSIQITYKMRSCSVIYGHERRRPPQNE